MREGEVPPPVCLLPGIEIVPDLTSESHHPIPFFKGRATHPISQGPPPSGLAGKQHTRQAADAPCQVGALDPQKARSLRSPEMDDPAAPGDTAILRLPARAARLAWGSFPVGVEIRCPAHREPGM